MSEETGALLTRKERRHSQAGLHISHRKPVGEIIAAVVIVLLVIAALHSAATNPRFKWDVFAQYFFSPPILEGLLLTLQLTVVAMLVGCVLGALLALMRLSNNRVLVGISWFYAWVFRGTPILVQLILWYNLGALYPTLGIQLPFGPMLVSVDASSVITAWTAAILGLGLHEAAYMAEIIRGGIQGIDRGQSEAASALGMPRAMQMRRVILPQAMRLIIPPTGNQLIGMLKMTSLVSALALSELLFSAQAIYSRTFEIIPLLLVVAAWYLLITSILMVGQSHIERRFSRGVRAVVRPNRRSEAAVKKLPALPEGPEYFVAAKGASHA